MQVPVYIDKVVYQDVIVEVEKVVKTEVPVQVEVVRIVDREVLVEVIKEVSCVCAVWDLRTHPSVQICMRAHDACVRVCPCVSVRMRVSACERVCV
jgi:hypothetical protein